MSSQSLYVHFPWCIKKCPYCDFNSHQLRGSLPEESYLNSLFKDIDFETSFTEKKRIHSIFLGGGTPSLFSAQSMEKLLEYIAKNFQLSEQCEITMEANPGTLEHADFNGYLASGINRLSMGVQSFNDQSLRALGRVHNSIQAKNALKKAKKAGFENINIDLMFGLPNQSLDMALDDVQTAFNFSTQHLSLYQLTIEPNTLFHRFPPALPQDDQLYEIQQELHQVLDNHGYIQYEVSAFAKKGFQCAHNLNYWRFGDYVGIGAGAHGKSSSNDKIKRYWKLKHPDTYQKNAGAESMYGEQHLISDNDRLFECLMNVLRLKHGIETSLVCEIAKLDYENLVFHLAHAVDHQLLEVNKKYITCTNKGYLFIDEILQRLLPELNDK